MFMENRYDKYKDSGIAWIGEIPEHWVIGRIKNIIHAYKAGPFGSSLITSNLNNIGKYLIYTPEHIAACTTNLDSNLYLPDYRINEMGQFEVGIGDVVFPIVGTLGRAMQITSDMPNGIINQRLSKFRLFENIICSNYFMWIFGKSDFYKIYIDMNSRGSFILNLTKLLIGNMPIMLPSLPEQQSIATYLDQKCGEIDELITLQEEMITKLQSYKQSVITEAVTKGLDKNVPLKDSGIEWIGEIPDHWNICKLKNIFLLSTGTTPKDFDKISEGDNLINWYTPSDILDSCNDLFNSQRKLSEKVIYDNKIPLFPIGTLLYVGIGASAGKVGYANENGYSNQQITGLIPLECYSRFYFYYLSALKDKIRDNAFFTTLPIINNTYLGQELIPYPPINEQQSIANYLDQKCDEIDELISIKQQKIEKLKDYKKSLIFECVTGKRKV
mgnify:CR=1 FL=1